MMYIIATIEGQPINEFGGRDYRKLGELNCDGIKIAKREAAKKYGKAARVMMPSEWMSLSSPKVRAAVKAQARLAA